MAVELLLDQVFILMGSGRWGMEGGGDGDKMLVGVVGEKADLRLCGSLSLCVDMNERCSLNFVARCQEGGCDAIADGDGREEEVHRNVRGLSL